MVDFGGWLMPVQYSGIMEEHHAVRNQLGVFDISHMGEAVVSGPRAQEWLDSLLTNNVARLQPGCSHYTFLLNEEGGVIDDLLVYHYAPGKYLLVINASRIDEDVAWMQAHLTEGVHFEDRSAAYAGLAVQGPGSAQLFDRFFQGRYSRPARNEIIGVEEKGVSLLISRTGYTGEDGFELFFDAAHATSVWDAILAAGAPLGIKPCGLGARDTLRLEMCYPLNGSDLSPRRTPLEAGLGFFVDLQKPAFIGREALVAQRTAGIADRLVPFRMLGKTPPPRAHYAIYKNGEPVAEITSGSLSPTLGVGIGMAYLPAQWAKVNEEIEIDIRGRRFPAVIDRKPLHRKS